MNEAHAFSASLRRARRPDARTGLHRDVGRTNGLRGAELVAEGDDPAGAPEL